MSAPAGLEFPHYRSAMTGEPLGREAAYAASPWNFAGIIGALAVWEQPAHARAGSLAPPGLPGLGADDTPTLPGRVRSGWVPPVESTMMPPADAESTAPHIVAASKNRPSQTLAGALRPQHWYGQLAVAISQRLNYHRAQASQELDVAHARFREHARKNFDYKDLGGSARSLALGAAAVYSASLATIAHNVWRGSLPHRAWSGYQRFDQRVTNLAARGAHYLIQMPEFAGIRQAVTERWTAHMEDADTMSRHIRGAFTHVHNLAQGTHRITIEQVAPRDPAEQSVAEPMSGSIPGALLGTLEAPTIPIQRCEAGATPTNPPSVDMPHSTTDPLTPVATPLYDIPLDTEDATAPGLVTQSAALLAPTPALATLMLPSPRPISTQAQERAWQTQDVYTERARALLNLHYPEARLRFSTARYHALVARGAREIKRMDVAGGAPLLASAVLQAQRKDRSYDEIALRARLEVVAAMSRSGDPDYSQVMAKQAQTTHGAQPAPITTPLRAPVTKPLRPQTPDKGTSLTQTASAADHQPLPGTPVVQPATSGTPQLSAVTRPLGPIEYVPSPSSGSGAYPPGNSTQPSAPQPTGPITSMPSLPNSEFQSGARDIWRLLTGLNGAKQGIYTNDGLTIDATKLHEARENTRSISSVATALERIWRAQYLEMTRQVMATYHVRLDELIAMSLAVSDETKLPPDAVAQTLAQHMRSLPRQESPETHRFWML